MNMVQGEVAAPSRSTLLRGSDDCVRATASIARFLSGSSLLREDRALHAHISACSDCNEHYRSALLTAARHGREARNERKLHAAPPVRTRRVFAHLPTKPRGKRAGLKTFLFAAIGMALFACMFPARSGPTAAVLAGRARVGEHELAADAAITPLRNGDWLTTEPFSRARIAGDKASFELGASTCVRVEDASRAALRLETGELWLDGPCSVSTAWGCVEVVEGRAHLLCEVGDVLLESIDASVLASTSRGEMRVAPGETVRLATLAR